MRLLLLFAVVLATVSVLCNRKYERIADVSLVGAYCIVGWILWMVIPWGS